MIHQRLNEELKSRASEKLRLDWYQIVPENDCLFIMDRPDCPVSQSSKKWPLNYLLKSEAESVDFDSCFEMIVSLVQLGLGAKP